MNVFNVQDTSDAASTAYTLDENPIVDVDMESPDLPPGLFAPSPETISLVPAQALPETAAPIPSLAPADTTIVSAEAPTDTAPVSAKVPDDTAPVSAEAPAVDLELEAARAAFEKFSITTASQYTAVSSQADMDAAFTLLHLGHGNSGFVEVPAAPDTPYLDSVVSFGPPVVHEKAVPSPITGRKLGDSSHESTEGDTGDAPNSDSGADVEAYVTPQDEVAVIKQEPVSPILPPSPTIANMKQEPVSPTIDWSADAGPSTSIDACHTTLSPQPSSADTASVSDQSTLVGSSVDLRVDGDEDMADEDDEDDVDDAFTLPPRAQAPKSKSKGKGKGKAILRYIKSSTLVTSLERSLRKFRVSSSRSEAYSSRRSMGESSSGSGFSSVSQD